MLTVTDHAADMIRELADDADLPEYGGLRIAGRPDQPSLEMSLVEAPEPTDNVVVTAGVRVFLDQQAAERLAEETLDARTAEVGPAFFLE